MIRLPDTILPASAATALNEYQASLDALSDYGERVTAARREWERRNVGSNAAFLTVRETLETLCCGARRCNYCENSAADEIDHVRPKSLYPEATFVWENYVYTCGLCNGPKNNQFAVFATPGDVFIPIQHRRNEPPMPPPPGDMVLLHPRFENPLEFLILDLQDTFEFFPLQDEPIAKRRAEYTIELLRLNTRDYLLKARGMAYRDFRARLHEYIRKRDVGAAADELSKLTEAFQACNHQAVWQEMKRQGPRIPELRLLFEEVPEAVTW